MVILCLAVLIGSVFISVFFTWIVRNMAACYGWTSGSIYSHHIHERHVPRLGGLAVFLAFFTMLAVYILLSRWTAAGARMVPLNGDVLKLLVPAVLLFFTGLVDDLRGLTARSKLVGQIIGGVLLYAGGLHLFDASLHHLHPWLATSVSFVATVFFVVLMCNAMNLIDGLDGLAGGVGLFSMASILIFAWVGGAAPVVLTTVILGGAVAGFLVFNFCPASIFLGDSGSMFLGFMLSGLAITLANRQENMLNSLMLPVFCFALPLADTSISVLRRFLSRRPLFQADRGHVHHMLLNLGLSHRAAVWILYGASAIGTVLSLVLLNPSPLMLGSAGAVLLLLILFCVRKLGYQEFAELNRIWQRVDARETQQDVAPLLEEEVSREALVYAQQSTARPNRVSRRSEIDLDVDELASPSLLTEVPAEEATG